MSKELVGELQEQHASNEHSFLREELEIVMPLEAMSTQAEEYLPLHASSEQTARRIPKSLRYAAATLCGALFVGGASEVAIYEYRTHHAVHNEVDKLPDNQITNILSSGPTTMPTTPEASSSSTPKSTPEKPTIPEYTPAIPTRIVISRLDIDTSIIQTEAKNEGQKNSWGGNEYFVDFPIDSGKQKARFAMVRQEKTNKLIPMTGEPNTLRTTYAENPVAAMRTVIYGHAADYGPDLLFQHINQLQIGQDTFTLYADGVAYTYMVYQKEEPPKGSGPDALVNDADVYNLPKNNRKEAALVACLPNSDSHMVVIGYLVGVKSHKKTLSTESTSLPSSTPRVSAVPLHRPVEAR